jgi:diguanylate cyclase (GGDEF)-like protein
VNVLLQPHRNVSAARAVELARPETGRWLAPFAGLAILAQLSALIAPGVASAGLYAGSWVCLSAVVAIALWIRTPAGRRASPWLALLVPAGYLGVLGLLLASQHFVATGLGVVLVLPMAWAALTHRPRESMVVVALDLVLVGVLSHAAHDSGSVIARRTVLWGLSATIIVFAAHRLRTWLAEILDEREEALRQAEVLTAAARELNLSLDPDQVIATGLALAAEIATPPGELPPRANYCRIVDGHVYLHAECDPTGAWAGADWPLYEHAWLAQVVATGRPVTGVLDSSTLGPKVLALSVAQRVTHGGWVPVHIDGELHGIVAIAARGASITPRHLARCAAIAEILELALTNALRHERSRVAAHTDPLTSLANRRGLETLVAERRGRRSLAALAIDVDRLKQVNDRHGHAAGDRLLCDVGSALGSVLRSSDVVARTGGDEFACVLFDADAVTAERVARRMLEALQAVETLDGTPRVSIGVALGDGADTLEACLISADRAMYRAKQAGGMRYAVAGDEEPAPA